MIMTCGSCGFFSSMTSECRKNPPLALPLPAEGGQIKMIGYWPPTRPENWCGDHSKLPKNQLLVVGASVDQVTPLMIPGESN